MKRISELKRIILFGAGDGAIYRYFREKYENKIIAVLDNDQSKWGDKVYAPEVLKNYINNNVDVIVTTYQYWGQIEKQIKEIGWTNNIIIAQRDLADFKEVDFRFFEAGLTQAVPKVHTCFVELSGICNCKCVYCCFHGAQNHKEIKKLMTWETLEKTVQQLKTIPSLKTISNIGAGETFVHPEWYEMTKYMVENLECEKLAMYTNGMLLSKDNVKKMLDLPIKKSLAISIDGNSPEENDFYRVGSDYEKIKENVYTLLEMNNKSENQISIVIRNCHPIEKEVFDEYHGIINPNFTADIPEYLRKDFPDIAITGTYTIVYKDKETEVHPDNLPYYVAKMPEEDAFCMSPFTEMAIDSQGNLLRCACGNGNNNYFGNVFDDNILDLWINDDVMRRTRNSFLNGGKDKPFCFGCSQSGDDDYWLYTGASRSEE